MREATIRARVNKATFPAPARFVRAGARWSAADLDLHAAGEHPAFLPLDGAPREQARQRRLARLLDEVRWWVWRHGDARVPVDTDGRMVGEHTSRLGPRITKVRAAYRAGALPPAVAAQFERLPGWTWDHVNDTWRARLDDVLTRWPTRLTSEDRAWLALQRAKFDRLGEKYQSALRGVPGLLGYQGNHRVAEFIEAVHAWLSAHPGQDTSTLQYGATVKVRGQVVPVGRRAGYYRRRYLGKEARQPLTDAEVAAIEGLPGWSWEQSSQHVSAAGARGRTAR